MVTLLKDKITLDAKKYREMKEELNSWKLTALTLADKKLMKEIKRGIQEIKSGRWTKVRDDLASPKLRRGEP